MKIAFLCDLTSPNSRSWISALERLHGCDVHTWSLQAPALGPAKLWDKSRYLFALPRLRRWLRRLAPDIVIAYRTTSYGFLGALAGVHPLVVAAQGETDVWPPGSLTAAVTARTARYGLRRADLIHAFGAHMTPSLIQYGAPPERLLVLPRGIDTDRFHFSGRAAPSSTLRLITTRQLFHIYGHPIILRGLAQARARGVDARLDLVGGGPDADALRRLTGELGLDAAVTFHGPVANDALPGMLRAADVYISLPSTEGVSASLLEAMACGAVPLISDITANRDWVRDGDNGLLVAHDDAAAVADALVRIADDPAWAQRARVHNRTLVEARGSLKINMARYHAAYQRLIDERRPDRVRDLRHRRV